jgi:hypothetical protein
MFTWPSNRTLKFFFTYWMLFCAVSVFTGAADRFMNWQHSLSPALGETAFAILMASILAVLFALAKYSSARFGGKSKDSAGT